jgi:hypothetical protein
MKKTVCTLIVAFLFAVPVAATAAKAEVKADAKIVLMLPALKALADLPQKVNLAVMAGASEEELGKTLKKMKEDKVEGEAAVEVADHFKKQAEDGSSDKGLSDVVHECLAQGKKGTELVACVHTDWGKKPKVKKGDEGKNLDEGKPDDKGQPEDKGKVEDKGKPEGKGKVEDKGKPEDKGKVEDKGKSEGKGKVEDKGKPEGKGKLEGKGGH